MDSALFTPLQHVTRALSSAGSWNLRSMESGKVPASHVRLQSWKHGIWQCGPNLVSTRDLESWNHGICDSSEKKFHSMLRFGAQTQHRVDDIAHQRSIEWKILAFASFPDSKIPDSTVLAERWLHSFQTWAGVAQSMIPRCAGRHVGKTHSHFPRIQVP